MIRLGSRPRLWAGVTLAALVVGFVFAVQGKNKLYINGSLASSGVIVRNNVTYAPIKDVAQAMGLTVVSRPDGFELKKAGGANPIGGITGKVGDTLFDGNFSFKVVEVIRTDKYKKRFDSYGGEVVPLSPGDDVLVLICRIKNGVKRTITVLLPGGEATVVTDNEEHSWQPHAGADVDLRSRGENLVPGSAVDFALTFSIPKKAVLKDLIYHIYHPENLPQTKFRVSLKTEEGG